MWKATSSNTTHSSTRYKLKLEPARDRAESYFLNATQSSTRYELKLEPVPGPQELRLACLWLGFARHVHHIWCEVHPSGAQVRET